MWVAGRANRSRSPTRAELTFSFPSYKGPESLEFYFEQRYGSIVFKDGWNAFRYTALVSKLSNILSSSLSLLSHTHMRKQGIWGVHPLPSGFLPLVRAAIFCLSILNRVHNSWPKTNVYVWRQSHLTEILTNLHFSTTHWSFMIIICTVDPWTTQRVGTGTLAMWKIHG